MLPQIEFFGRIISVYGLMALVGGLVSGTVFCRLIKKRGLDDNPAIAFLLFVVLGVIFGSHILFGIVNFDRIILIFNSGSFAEFKTSFAEAFGGSVFYGGLLGGIAAGLITIRVMKLDKVIYADCIAAVIPLFHFFARIGCFFAGCCYGIPSKFGFITTTNNFIPGLNGVRRFPVQLLEAAFNLIIFIILFMLLQRAQNKIRGKLLFIYLLLYSAVRFGDEFLRGDAYRGYFFGLSVSQIISIVLFAVSVIFLTLDNTRKRHKSIGRK